MSFFAERRRLGQSGRWCLGRAHVGSYLALAYALGQLPATVSSVGLLAQVPPTAVLAVPLLGEPIAPTQIFGGLLVLAGIFIVNRP
jgi:drug/metabolite transporter (DMT)-like permease